MTRNMAWGFTKGFGLPAYNTSINVNKKKTVRKFEAMIFTPDETSK